MASKIDAAWLKNLVHTMVIGPTDAAQIRDDILQFVAPTYTQIRQGTQEDLDGTIAHLAEMRGMITSLDVQVEALVVSADGRQFASRHVSTINGDVEHGITVVLFADLTAEGKMERVVEIVQS